MSSRFAAVVVLALCGCSSAERNDGGNLKEGTPTESVCTSDNQLSYENFGRAFMEGYCTRCHSSKLTGAARNGAPLAHDFDSVDGVAAVGEHIDEWAAAGPKAVNEIMPPTDPTPSEDERRKLGQWIACKTPAAVGDAGTLE